MTELCGCAAAVALCAILAGGVCFAGAAGKVPVTAPDGYRLVWSDEFDKDGPPDPTKWTYELGFIRNNEAQLYQRENAVCKGGVLIIEARRERKPNPYLGMGKGWKFERQYGDYTSACLTTWGKGKWQYGRFEMRGRIDTRAGLWPAWWTLGTNGHIAHSHCGEIDIMEYYGARGLMSNVCWGPWNIGNKPISTFNDPEWSSKFHVWRMDWDENSLKFYVDDMPWNSQDLSKTNTDEGNPFRKPQYMLLNLAIGGDWGGDPSHTTFPARLEVDYVRIFQKASESPVAPAPAAPAPKAATPRKGAAKADLVGHWTLDEKSGETVADSAGAGAGEIINASGVERIAGKVGGALEFKGSSYVKIPDSDALHLEREITVAAWIRLADAAGNQCVAGRGPNFVFWEIAGGERPCNILVIGGGPTAHWLRLPYTKDASFFVGRWHHVAFTYDGSKVVNYLDGAPDGQPTPLVGDMSTGWDWLGIGTNGPWAFNSFKGAIDDFRIYGRALPAAEIKKLAAEAPAK